MMCIEDKRRKTVWICRWIKYETNIKLYISQTEDVFEPYWLKMKCVFYHTANPRKFTDLESSTAYKVTFIEHQSTKSNLLRVKK